MNTLGTVVVGLVATIAMSCDRSGSSTAGVDIPVRDSAGIEILEHRLAGATPVIAFRVADSAAVAIGQAEGEAPYLFSRVNAATRLPDGRIVVVDSRAGELRFFDANGRHLQTVGRTGEGPGEFGAIWKVLRVPGDTILITDRRHARLTAVTAAGEFARVTTLRPLYDAAGVRSLELHGRLRDGRLLATHPATEFEAPPPDGLQVSSYVYRAVDPDMPSVDSIATLYQEQTILQSRPRGEMVIVSVQSIPLTTAASQAAAPDGFYYTDGRAFTISRYSTSGGLNRLIRLDRVPAPVTGAVVDEAVAHATAPVTVPARRTEIERRLREAPLPDSLPAFAELMVDGAGRLWAREWSMGADRPRRWLVFGEDDRLLGAVDVPAGCTPLEIGTDYVLCSARDELDVERVELRSLVRVND